MLKILARTVPFRNYVDAATSKHTTVDSSEILRFEKFVDEWWDLMGAMKPLHSMNKLRIPLVRDGLINARVVDVAKVDSPKPLQGLDILDVGCGGGILSEPLSRLGCKVTGIDASPNLIEIAKAHLQTDKNNLNLTYLASDIEEHAKGNVEKYDAVVASEVLEHVANKSTFLEACVKCLKPGGSIFITTINKTCFSYLGAIIISEEILNLLPKGTHHYDKFIAPHHVQRLLEDQNCKTKLTHGMLYNIVNNKWYWISDHSVNYALHAVKLN